MSTEVPNENGEEGAQSHGLLEFLEYTFGVSSLWKDSAGSADRQRNGTKEPTRTSTLGRSRESARESEGSKFNARDVAIMQLMKTPKAEDVYNKLRADDKEWHSAALRLDACENLVGKLWGRVVFRRCRKHGSVSGPFHPLFGSHWQPATLRQETVRSRSKRLCSVHFWRCGVLVESGGVLLESGAVEVESQLLWLL